VVDKNESAELQTFNPLSFTNCRSSPTVRINLSTSSMSAPPSVELLDYICHSLYKYVRTTKSCHWPGRSQVFFFFPSNGSRKENYSPHIHFPGLKPIHMLALQVA